MTWLDDFARGASQALEDRALEALYARGVTDEQVSTFGFGFIDRRLPDLDYPKHFLDWCFNGAKLDDMLVLPLTNTLGEIKGFQFRHVERDQGGYKDYLPDRAEAVLFGLGQALPHVWASRRIFLVEGAFDLCPLQRYFPDVVATLTADVPERVVRILRRIQVRDIFVAYDNDKTGRESSTEIQHQYGKEFDVHLLRCPPLKTVNGKTTKDFGELWETLGEEGFRQRIRDLASK